MSEAYDYHFLILAPGLAGAWFLQAARQYWLRFKPIVTDDWQLIDYMPEGASVAVTVLANPDIVNVLRTQTGGLREDIRLDVVVARDLPMMEVFLNRRAEAGQPFGQVDLETY